MNFVCMYLFSSKTFPLHVQNQAEIISVAVKTKFTNMYKPHQTAPQIEAYDALYIL